MKTRLILSTALVLAVTLAACSDAIVAPDAVNFELVDEGDRVDAGSVNAHVYGSFSLTFETQTEGGYGVILSGPANFPGNPKNAGTCDNGLWINSQGKRTSGSLDKPHPHCVGETNGETTTVYVVLEPISSIYTTYGTAGQQIQFNADEEEGRVRLTGSGGKSTGQGAVVGYAIDASTLGTTNRRVGTISFALNQYDNDSGSYFEDGCLIDGSETAPKCLDLVISAEYAPLPAPDGVGVATSNVQGFLYWSPADAPFNYGN